MAVDLVVQCYAIAFVEIFLHPPELLRKEPFFERKSACKPTKMVFVQGVRDSRA